MKPHLIYLCVVYASICSAFGQYKTYEINQDEENENSFPHLQVMADQTINKKFHNFAEGILASTDSFSFCFWFNLLKIRQYTTLVSYAISSIQDNVIKIVLTMNSVKIELLNTKRNDDQEVKIVIFPLNWYSMCAIYDKGTRKIYIQDKYVEHITDGMPFHLNGSLVIGQEQDDIDSDYTVDQGFDGLFTFFTFWATSITDEEIKNFQKCKAFTIEPYLEWNDFDWKVHESGKVFVKYMNPCSLATKDKFIFFNFKKTWFDAYNFLQVQNLEFAVPENEEEQKYIGNALAHHEAPCGGTFSRYDYVWLGIRFNKTLGTFCGENGKINTYNSTWLTIKSSQMLKEGHFYVYQSVDGIWVIDTDDIKFCFVSRKKTGKLYYLKILNNNFNYLHKPDLTYVLASSNYSSYFHGYGKYDIVQSNSQTWSIQLKEGAVAEKLPISISREDIPLGKLSWRCTPENLCGKEFIDVSLSTCVENEFTCKDSRCIDFIKRCDATLDCADGSDEAECSNINFEVGYLADAPASSNSELTVKVNINDILRIDLMNMLIDVDFQLDLFWFDSRLTFQNIMTKTSLKAEKPIWEPQLKIMKNLRTLEDKMEPVILRRSNGTLTSQGYEYPGSENPLMRTQHYFPSIFCRFTLTDYPWDVQRCRVIIKVTNMEKFYLSNSSTVTGCPIENIEYEITSCELDNSTEAVADNIVFVIHLRRRPSYYIWTTYVPVSLLIGIGHGTLMLPVDAFPERGEMSLTTLLVLIALYTETSSQLPKTSNLKLIDIWFVFAIFYLSLIIAVHIMTCQPESHYVTTVYPTRPLHPELKSLKIVRTEKRCFRLDRESILKYSRIIFAVAYVVFAAIYFFIAYN